MAARADNGMDPYTVLGISARAVRGKSDLYKLRHRCKSLIDGYLVKRQGSNARRVKWAFDQIKSKFSGQGRQEPNAEEQVPGPSPEATSGAATASPAASPPAAASPTTDPPVDRRDAIRNKAAARRERTAAGEEDPETAKRRETIREKLAVKRMLKQVPTVKEEEAKQKVVQFLASPPKARGAGPPERVSLNCPLSGLRIRLPGRGVECEHLQCFDLENFLTGKGSSETALCPVCGRELALPGGLFHDSYVAKIISTFGEKVKEVTFASNGAYSAGRPKPATAAKAGAKAAARPAPEAAVAAAAAATQAGPGTTAASAAPAAAKRPREEPKPAEQKPPAETASSPAAAPTAETADDSATARGAETSKEASGKKQAEKTPKPMKPKPRPKPTPEQLREEAEREEKRKRAKLYHTLRAEEVVDPADESNYVVVELPTANMGLILRPNPSTIGGAFVEAIDNTGATARHGGLKVGDQLVGIGDRLVIGEDLDACIDLIVPDSRGAARLTVFRGSASSLYGKGHSTEWLTGFMWRVAVGEVDLTLPAPEPDPGPEESPEPDPDPDPDPDPEPEPPTPEPTPPPEKKKKNPRLSMSSESGSDGEADDDFSLELSGGEDSEGESPSEEKAAVLPERLAGQISGAGLDADLESCLEVIRTPPVDGTPEHLPSEPRLLARAVIKACTAANAENWNSLEEQEQAAWRLAARRRLARAAGERADRLEARRRQEVQDSQRSSLAEVAATAASRQGGGLEDPAEAMQEEERLLRVQPEKAIKFDHNRTAQLTLRSHSSTHVAFRVRTSAPKFIFVQPCAGTLQPGEWVSLQVCSSERHVTAAGDLKFLVQAVAAPDAEIMSKEKWAVLDSSAIQDWHLVGRL